MQGMQKSPTTIKNTVEALFTLMRPQFRNFPDDYLVLDVETTGLMQFKGGPKFDGDLITQLGYCLVKNGRAVSQAGLVLNWYDEPSIAPSWLSSRMAYTKQMVETKDGQPTGKSYHMSPDKMKSEGSNPREVLQSFYDTLQDARNRGIFFIAHNGYHFDARMLSSHFQFWLGKRWDFGINELFDTGMVFKGAQCGSPPWEGDTVKDWSYRTYKMIRKGVKWALDRACVKHFDLEKKDRLPMEEAHDAGFDCYICHLLFQSYVDIASGRKQEPEFLRA